MKKIKLIFLALILTSSITSNTINWKYLIGTTTGNGMLVGGILMNVLNFGSDCYENGTKAFSYDNNYHRGYLEALKSLQIQLNEQCASFKMSLLDQQIANLEANPPSKCQTFKIDYHKYIKPSIVSLFGLFLVFYVNKYLPQS